MKIVVIGLGYVGLSNAVLLAQNNQVIGVDISKDRVDLINARQSPIVDQKLTEYLRDGVLNLKASLDLNTSVVDADYVIVSTPTNYDQKTNFFDTLSVEKVIKQVIRSEPRACIVVKSTIPIGFVDDIRSRLDTQSVIFSPEFLREGSALFDNLYPSRIVVGEISKRAKIFARLLAQGALKKDIDTLFTGSKEAEAIKLFSNTYLAMRVAFFNELDNYALAKSIDCKQIIEGVSLDPRIGSYYNNPSFGYGGYCLPKDTKQLLASYEGVPQHIISAIVESNLSRMDYLANVITQKKPKVVGIYRLAMKTGSDNFRTSSILEIMERIKDTDTTLIIFDPSLAGETIFDAKIEKNLIAFKEQSDLILANRLMPELEDVIAKVFTRDLFGFN